MASIAKWRWEDIKTPTDLKAFLGFTQWYSVYIKDYALMAGPLQRALQGLCLTKAQKRQLKEKSSKRAHERAKPLAKMTEDELIAHHRERNLIFWTKEMQQSFEDLKRKFCKEVVLQFPDLSKDWYISVDASNFAFGGVLEQADSEGTLRPVAFFSKKLQGTVTEKNGRVHKTGQCNWHISDQEMYGIVATIFKFRSWLINGNVKIKVHTDHKGLETWTKEDFDRLGGPIGRRSRWHQFLSRFPIEVVYIPGDKNTVADVLSRWAYPSYTANPDVGIHSSEAESQSTGYLEYRSW